MSNIVLYTNNNYNCRLIERKLINRNIKYDISFNLNEIAELGYKETPVLKKDSTYMDYNEALTWLKTI